MTSFLTLIRNWMWPERTKAATIAQRDPDPELPPGGDLLQTTPVDHEPHPPLREPEDLDFDEEWYLRRYPDVALAVAAGRGASGLAHFRLHGHKEGRLPKPPIPAAGNAAQPSGAAGSLCSSHVVP